MLNVMIIPSNGFGLDGISSCIMNYYRKFDHNKIKISIIIPKITCEIEIFKNLEEEFIVNDDLVYRLDRRNVINYIFSLRKIIIKNNIDIIHIHGSSSLMTIELLAGILGNVKVRIVHSHNTTCKHKFIHKILKIPFNLLCTHRLACGKEAGKWLFDKQEFIIMKNGIDVDKFKLDEKIRKRLRAKYNLNGKCVIGHVGAFNDQKNHKFLIDLFMQLKNLDSKYELVCIGDGYKKREIEKYIEELKLKNILLLGRKSNISELLNMMDIMILPSLYEGLPVIAIEWQAKGIPSYVSENVTREVAFSNYVKFLNLNLGAAEWAKKINDDINSICKYKGDSYVKSAGYDINNNVKELIDYYLNSLKEINKNDFTGSNKVKI